MLRNGLPRMSDSLGLPDLPQRLTMARLSDPLDPCSVLSLAAVHPWCFTLAGRVGTSASTPGGFFSIHG